MGGFGRQLRCAESVLAIMLATQAPAFAQDEGAASPAGPETQQTDAQASDEIVVTGSRLRGAAPVGSTVIALGREDITAAGAISTDRLIQQIPQVLDLGVSENSRAQGGGSGNITYGNTINLRGIVSGLRPSARRS